MNIATLARMGLCVLTTVCTQASVVTAGTGLNSTITVKQGTLQSAQPKVASVAPEQTPAHTRAEFQPQGAPLLPLSDVRVPKAYDKSQAELPGVKVGSTWYDFQTNGSMAERIALTEQGSDRYIQMLWMTSTDRTRDAQSRALGFNESRGSHYSVFDVSSPLEPSQIVFQTKVEPQRERYGWPAIAQFSNGAIGTPSHTPVTWWRNEDVADEAFTRFRVAEAADSALWPRCAVDRNDNVHLIYNRSIPGGEGNRLVYRRSVNRGATWENEIAFTGPTGLGGGTLGLPTGSGGDSYAIAANGMNVAIMYLDNSFNLWIRTSRDGGASWPLDSNSVRIVFQPNYRLDSTDVGTGMVYQSDTVATPGTAMDLIIDEDGTVHYVISAHPSFRRGFRPTGAARSGDTLFAMYDANLFRQLGVYYGTLLSNQLIMAAQAGGGEWNGEGLVVNRRVYVGPCATPQLGLDEEGNLYMVYASMKNGDTKDVSVEIGAVGSTRDTTVTGLNMHVYATRKLKANSRWFTSVDLTPQGMNCQWSTLCNTVKDGIMYIGYAANTTPGDHVTNVLLPDEETDIYLYPFETSGLSSELFEPGTTSVQDVGSVLSNVAIAPNPAHSLALVRGIAVTDGEMRVSVVSTMGTTVWTSSTAATAGSEFTVSIPTATFAAGAYTVVLEQNGSRVSTMLSVVR